MGAIGCLRLGLARSTYLKRQRGGLGHDEHGRRDDLREPVWAFPCVYPLADYDPAPEGR